MSVFKGLFALNLFVLTLICNGQQTPKDWLIDNSGFKATLEQAENGKDLVLTNGLVKRVFRVQPNAASTGYENLSNGQQLLRAVKPEAVLALVEEESAVVGTPEQKKRLQQKML